MGILRIYLALCVVLGHSGLVLPWLHNGKEAVQIFYLISGFYMAHIANKYGSALEFYFSRFFRIYTPYYFILILIISISVLSGLFLNFWGPLASFVSQMDKNGIWGIVVTSISNLTIYFQDWVLFLTHDAGEAFSFTSNFWKSSSPLHKFLIIPQAWSIGVELTFYLFVPFLAKQGNKTLLIVLVVSLAARLSSYHFLDLEHDPWTYRFFPFELAIFILGMLSNRLYGFVKGLKVIQFMFQKNSLLRYSAGLPLLIAFIFLTKKATVFISLYSGAHYAMLISYVGWALSLPMIFLFSERYRFDRFIGELSYPVYLLHLFVIIFSSRIMYMMGAKSAYLGYYSSFISVAIAALIVKFVIIPMDRKRYSLAKRLSRKFQPL